MAVETTIPNGKPGVAEFSSETFGNLGEPRFGDGEANTTNITLTAGANIDLPLYGVINLAGSALAVYNAVRGPTNANYILAEPIVILSGATMTFAVYRTGYWNMDGLIWDASYDTDAKKKAAFEGSLSPTIFIGKKAFNSGAIYP